MAPNAIILLTFTNKAAAEMKSRLVELLSSSASRVVAGTFHSVCARFLREHGHLIGVDPAFTVADDSDRLTTLRRLAAAQPRQSDVPALDEVARHISHAKNHELSPEAFRADAARHGHDLAAHEHVARLFVCYEAALAAMRSLDFDDLLRCALRLFERHPEVLSRFSHVLVDEFQDTNNLQLRLAVAMCQPHGNLTVVGDPDQSIYGWRYAQTDSFTRLQQPPLPASHQPATVYRFALETNYRSSGRIIEMARRVIAQNRACEAHTIRPPTGGCVGGASGPAPREPPPALTAAPPPSRAPSALRPGVRPIMLRFVNATQEAAALVSEIERLKECCGGLLGYGDFAILMRINAMSRYGGADGTCCRAGTRATGSRLLRTGAG